MTCRRTSEIDLTGFLDHPRRPEFAEFREHYPRCRDCSAEVRAWTELRGALRSGLPAAHPDPEQLARYDGAPGRLAPAERRALEAHLATCAACRDELRALGSFSPATRASAAPAREAAPSRVGGWLAAPRRLLWHPALAYALLAAFVAPTLYRQVAGPPPVVEQPAEATALAKAERARRMEEEALAAGERQIPGEIAPAYGLAPAPAAPSASTPERTLSAEAPRAPVPEPKATAAPPRAAAPYPRAAARPRPAPELRIPRDRAPEFGAAREAPSAEADRETATTRFEAAAPVPMAAAVAPELDAEEVEQEGFAEDAVAEMAVARATALALRAGEIPTVSAASALAGLRLSVIVPEPGAGEIEIRVVAPGGGRELRERHPADADAVTIEVPPAWLVPGRYEVSTRRLGAGLVRSEARYAFEVGQEAPLER